MTDDKEVRARNATALLENPLLVEALAALEQEAVDDWIGTPKAAVDDRERFWVTVKVARRFREYLESVVNDQRFATNRAVRAPLP